MGVPSAVHHDAQAVAVAYDRYSCITRTGVRYAWID
jgi:hypothetical protein